jgi:acetylornithine/N-succinyldiaminopimelate aminotransferase
VRAESARALASALTELAARHGATLRGSGHLWGFVLSTPCAEAVRDRCFERGLLVNAARPDVLRLMPALDVGSAEVAAMRDILGTALAG